ncbi:MAG: formylmethanofuran dehydrogenase subunit E family protein [bacterium]
MLTYQETIRFHGHNGPFLALGYKFGKFLRQKLKPRGIMDLKITVSTILKKPYTCLIDGLQCATTATMGKGNIIAKKQRGKCILVSVQKNKKVYNYKIKDKAIEICLGKGDLEKLANKIFRTNPDELWKRI